MRFQRTPENLLLRAAARAFDPGKLKHVVFEPGEPLWEPEGPVHFALFPTRGVVSLQVHAGGEKRADIALCGREGFLEPAFLFDDRNTKTAAVAFTAGEGFAMEPALFRAFWKNTRFREAVHGYVRVFLVMAHRISVCNRLHVIEKSFVGRLLLIQDRAEGDSFQLTQGFMSRILGVRKATISRAAARLQDMGAIRYNRHGQLTIVDRHRLERQSCSCYRAIKDESDKLISALGGF